ncbi:hypothetical protein [Salinispira pacifica]
MTVLHPGLRNADRLALLAMAIGFCVGTCTHTRDAISAGLFGYRHVSVAVNIFWTLLTFADPAATLLLLLRSRAGLILASLIMVSDVAVNGGLIIARLLSGGSPDLLYFAFQLPFGVLVVAYSLARRGVYQVDRTSSAVRAES